MAVTIVRAVQTSVACPSQWDAWDGQGQFWYLRYRHAHGEARRYAEGPDWYRGTHGDPLEQHRADYGDSPWDGETTLPELCAQLGFAVSPDVEYTGWGQHAADELYKALEQAAAAAVADDLSGEE
jgi:hypothetical protein